MTKPQGDERRMTFIVVPHGGDALGTRSFEVTYRTLRMAVIGGGVALVLLLVMAVSWALVAAQAARVPVMKREIAELQRERQRVEQLARTLARMEARYEQMRTMLGSGVRADTAGAGTATPEAEDGAQDTVPPDSADGSQAMLPRAWPLARPGFVTRGLLPRPPAHPGIDIAVAMGTRVRATGGGTVLAAGEDRVYGRFVRIGHADGYESVYGHVSRVLVAVRDRVRGSQVIALSGNTGLSTGPHLHFEILKDGKPVDPRLLVRNPRE